MFPSFERLNAGSHNMLAKMPALFRQGEPAGDEWNLLFQKWTDEMDKLVADCRNGKI